MAKRRDYQRESARRNELARQSGWKSYNQKRYAQQKFNESSLDIQGKWGRFLIFKGRGLSKSDKDRAFRAFWQGLVDHRTSEDRSRHSARAEWFVEWLDAVPDYDTWEERYGGNPNE